MPITLKLVTLSEILPIRQAVLRPGKTIEHCYFDMDQDKETLHLGLYENNNLAGIATLVKNHHPQLAKNAYQLRGMAVLKDFQKKQYGQKLLTKATDLAAEKNMDLLWMNARESALKFYQKSGFNIFGNAFEIPEIGTHFVMYKHLTDEA